MALRDLPIAFSKLLLRDAPRRLPAAACRTRRHASTKASTEDLADLEPSSSLVIPGPSEEVVKSYDPVKRAEARRRELPPSRYKFRPPRYYRGPLHPHQPPPSSDPSSRQFVPGPFNLPRLQETYESTVAPDLMTLTYKHKPPGTVELPKADRLRSWDDSSPYHKNRPKRGPRGGDVLPLIEKDITWRNVPEIEAVTVHTMVKGAIENSGHLHVAGIMLQAITGVRPKIFKAKKNVQQFGIRPGMAVSMTCHIRGPEAWEFVDKCVNLVFPRIKDWPGVKGTTGDSSGNLSWGFSPEAAQLFPEVEVNYDMYPPKMIPGFHVTVHTTTETDRNARLLLSSLGVPFYGKLVN